MIFALLAAINLLFLNDNKYVYSFDQTKNTLIADNKDKKESQVKEIEFKEYRNNY